MQEQNRTLQKNVMVAERGQEEIMKQMSELENSREGFQTRMAWAVGDEETYAKGSRGNHAGDWGELDGQSTWVGADTTLAQTDLSDILSDHTKSVTIAPGEKVVLYSKTASEASRSKSKKTSSQSSNSSSRTDRSSTSRSKTTGGSSASDSTSGKAAKKMPAAKSNAK